MSHRDVGFLTSVLGFVLGACVAQVEQPGEADDEAVLDHVEALGYARESAEVNGDYATAKAVYPELP